MNSKWKREQELNPRPPGYEIQLFNLSKIHFVT
jgi:hypothetical protein